MATQLTTAAVEQSTYVIQCSFTDEDGDAVTPSSVTWTLIDHAHNIVNSREQVSIAAAATIDIVLSGADLAVTDLHTQHRTLIVEAVYDGSVASNLPIKKSINFLVEPLPYIA